MSSDKLHRRWSVADTQSYKCLPHVSTSHANLHCPQLLGALHAIYSLVFFFWNNSEDFFSLIQWHAFILHICSTKKAIVLETSYTHPGSLCVYMDDIRQPFYSFIHLGTSDCICLRSCKTSNRVSCSGCMHVCITYTQRKLVFLYIALCMKHSNHIPSSAQVHELAGDFVCDGIQWIAAHPIYIYIYTTLAASFLQGEAL